MIMVEFDPGPPPEVAEHFAGVPSYAPHRDLFWYDWGPVFYRGRLDGSARVLCIASDPGPTERVAGRTLVGDAGQRVQGFLHKLGLTRSYACVNAYAYALIPSRSMTAIPILSEPEQRSWRNELFSMIIGQALQAIVTFGRQARIAVEQWTDAPAVMIKKVPHPSSRDAAKLITEWRAAVADLRTVVTPDRDGNNSGPNYDGNSPKATTHRFHPATYHSGYPAGWAMTPSVGSRVRSGVTQSNETPPTFCTP
jgi:uracil-DNA glycosylase